MRFLVAIGAVLGFLLLQRKRAGTAPAAPVFSAPSSPNDALDNLTEAIARMEGFYKQGSVAARTNNPGNVGTWGGKVASYPDPGDGWDRLYGYVSTNAAQHPEWDFYQTMRHYLTGSPDGAAGPGQDPNGYAEYVAGYMGVDPSQAVSTTLWG